MSAREEKPCKVAGCDRLIGRTGARGMCHRHWSLWRRNGDPLVNRRAPGNGSGRRPIHGLSGHRHYGRWVLMMHRCGNPANKSFADYGGRGIAVHPAWTDVRAFVAYLDAALGPCPPGHTLDRIDNDGNYEPGNVRWADRITQRANRRAAA